MTMRYHVLIVLLASHLCGCADDAEMLGPAACGGPLTLEEQELNVQQLRLIGRSASSEGSGDAAPVLSLVTDIAIDDEGDLYVADAMAGSIVHLDSSGAILERLGRPGAGPGEFETPYLVTIEGDTVLVFDANLWRVTYLLENGEVATERLEPDVSMGQVPEAAMNDMGTIYLLSYGPFQETMLERLAGRRGLVRGDNEIRRWNARAGTWTTIMTVRGPEVFVDRDAGSLSDPPFRPHPVLAAAADSGFWYGDAGGSELTLFTPTGDPVCVVRLPLPSLAVAHEERQAFYDASAVRGVPPERLQALRNRRAPIPVPDRKPVFRRVLASEEGLLWIQVPAPQALGTREVWYRVDLASGTMERLVLPEKLVLLEVKGSVLLGVYRDELDVQYVGVYRLTE